jgi:molecular chaperone DnaK (HSP70)
MGKADKRSPPSFAAQVILAGSSTLLPGLTSYLSMLFPPTVPITSTIDPSEVIAIGCALEALHLATLPESLKLEDVVKLAPNATTAQVDTVSAPIGIYIPVDGATGDAAEYIHTVVHTATPLPARRRVELPLAKGTTRVGLEVWQGKDEIKVEKVEKVEPNGKEDGAADDDDEDDFDDDEDEEDEEIRTRVTKKADLLAGIELDGISPDAKSVTFEIIVEADRKASLRLWETGKEDKAAVETLGA